jgi:hypothetical protein
LIAACCVLLLTACADGGCSEGCGIAIEDPAPPGATVTLTYIDLRLDAVTLSAGAPYTLQAALTITCTFPLEGDTCEVEPESFSVVQQGGVRVPFDPALNPGVDDPIIVAEGQSTAVTLAFALDAGASPHLLAYEEPLLTLLGPTRGYFTFTD